MTATLTRYKLVFHVPPAALEACKAAVFAAGAGRYPGSGNYTEVCYISPGTGQFRPGDTAKPHIGTPGALEQVEETRVETLCVGEEAARKAVAALKKVHPYEEPAYSVFKMEDF
ncbi:GTP cyclohydrolase 1 type 2/Nif3 [Chaetomium sp. MPI-CAGE-AT-0009]|nr:GTP cyclohydrolase 1 type 2/Nif3 [Chaetomium sp. MPI-CAGE-AT-0009]